MRDGHESGGHQRGRRPQQDLAGGFEGTHREGPTREGHQRAQGQIRQEPRAHQEPARCRTHRQAQRTYW